MDMPCSQACWVTRTKIHLAQDERKKGGMAKMLPSGSNGRQFRLCAGKHRRSGLLQLHGIKAGQPARAAVLRILLPAGAAPRWTLWSRRSSAAWSSPFRDAGVQATHANKERGNVVTALVHVISWTANTRDCA